MMEKRSKLLRRKYPSTTNKNAKLEEKVTFCEGVVMLRGRGNDVWVDG